MAEYVQLKFEEKVPLLTSLTTSKLLTFKEIKSYKQDIYQLYHKCQRPVRTLDDYFKLIDREISILGVLDVRRKEIGYQDKKKDLEEKIKNDISKYFGWAKKFFNQDIDLLLKEIDTYTSFDWKTKIRQTIQEALPIHGSKSPGLWLRATQYEVLYSGKNIRGVFQRAIRQHKSVERLYLEYLYYEWSRIEKELNNETNEEERKKLIEDGLNFGKAIYTYAKKECETRGGAFFIHILSIADRFEFTKDFKEYVIRDIDLDQNKDHKTLKYISLYKIQKTNNISDIFKRFADQMKSKCVEIPYETLLELIYESLTLKEKGGLLCTTKNMTIALKLCSSAAENKLLNDESFLIWIKLNGLYKTLLGPNGIEQIAGNNYNFYKPYEILMSLFHSQYPKNFYAASEYTIGKLSVESKFETGSYRIDKLLSLLNDQDKYNESNKDLLVVIQKFFTTLCVRVPVLNRNPRARAEEFPETFITHFPYRKFRILFDTMMSQYIEFLSIGQSQLGKGHLTTTSIEVGWKKVRELYGQNMTKFGHESFKSMVRFEETVATPTTGQKSGQLRLEEPPQKKKKCQKDLSEFQLRGANLDLSKTAKIFDDWTRMCGDLYIEPWIEYLRFIQQHEGDYYLNTKKYHEVYSSAQKSIKPSLSQAFFVQEIKLHEQQEAGQEVDEEMMGCSD